MKNQIKTTPPKTTKTEFEVGIMIVKINPKIKKIIGQLPILAILLKRYKLATGIYPSQADSVFVLLANLLKTIEV